MGVVCGGLGFNCVSRYPELHIIALFTLWFRRLVCGLDLGLVLDLLGLVCGFWWF